MATSRRLGPEVSVTQGHLLQSEQEGSLGYLLECNYPADHQAKKNAGSPKQTCLPKNI